MKNQKIIWQNNDFSKLGVTLLCETDASKELRITMPEGSTLDEHFAPATIIVQVLSGEIEFGVQSEGEEEIFMLGALEMISLAPNVVHRLLAKRDSIVRLTLSKHDTIERVRAVAGA